MEEYKFLIPIFFGGFAGSILTIVFNLWRNRIPKIKVYSEIESLYEKKNKIGDYDIYLVMNNKENVEDCTVIENAFIFRAVLKNTSSKPFPKFSFSITFPENMNPIIAKGNGSDKLHVVKQLNQLDPDDDAIRDVDFLLEPFNRNDTYEVQVVYTKTRDDDIDTVKPRLITNQDVKICDVYERNMRILHALSYVSWTFGSSPMIELVQKKTKM